MATLPHNRVSTPWTTSSSCSPGSAQSIHPTGSKTPDAGSTSLIEQPLATSESEPANLSRELLQLQQRVTTALRELLMVRASMDYCHRELGLKVELATCQNDPWLTKAEAWLAEAKVWHAKAKAWHADRATALQQAHLNSVSAWDQEMMAEEEKKAPCFCRGTLHSTWSLSIRGDPLQLLTGRVSLAPILEMPTTTQPQAAVDMGSVPVPLTLDTPEPGIKWWQLSSSPGMPNLGQEKEALCNLPEEPLCKTWKPLVRTLREVW